MGPQLRHLPYQQLRRYQSYDVSISELTRISSRFYFIAYEVDSPLKIRYNRFIQKYKTQKELTLEEFVDLDDKIRFNTEEYSLYSSNPEHQHLIRRRFHNRNNNILDFHTSLRDFNFQD